MPTISLPSHGGMNDGSFKPQEANPTLHGDSSSTDHT
jgi:hypothetical protein